MFCSQCGTQVSDGVRFCPSCGNNLDAGAGVTKAPAQSGAQTSSAVNPRFAQAQAAEPISTRAEAQVDDRASAIAPRGRTATAAVGGAIALILAAGGYWTWSNFAPGPGGGSASPAASPMGQRDASVIAAPAPVAVNQPDAKAVAAPAPGGVNQPDAKAVAAPAPGGMNQPDAKVVAAAAPGAANQRDAGPGAARQSGEQAEIAAARAALDREIAAEEREAKERPSGSAPNEAASSRGKARQ